MQGSNLKLSTVSLIAFISLVIVYLIKFLVDQTLTANPHFDKLAMTFLDPESYDDRADQYTYLISLLTIPLLSYFGTKATLPLLKKKEGHTFLHIFPFFAYTVFIFCILAIVGMLIFILFGKQISPSNAVPIPVGWLLYFFAALGFFSYLLLKQPKMERFFPAISYSLALLSIAHRYMGEYNLPLIYHFDPVFYDYVQIWSGKTLVTGNLMSLYGGNNFIIWLLSSWFIDSVSDYTLVMAIIMATSILLLVRFIFHVVPNRYLAFSGSLIFLYLLPPNQMAIRFENFYDVDLGLQYYPIRIIFISIFLTLFTSFIQKKDRKGVIWGMHGLVSVALYWNIDSGIVCVGTWVAVLCYQYLLEERWNVLKLFQTLFCLFGTLVVVWAAFFGLNFLFLGQAPKLSHFLYFQSLFSSGYFQSPIPLVGSWIFTIICYLVALALVSFDWLTGRPTKKTMILFTLAILGLGKFGYFVGRSFPFSSQAVMYPAVIIVLILVTSYLTPLPKASRSKLFYTFLTFILFAALSSSYLVYNSTKLVETFKLRVEKPNAAYKASLEVLRDFKESHPQGVLVVLSQAAGALHFDSKLKIPEEWDFPSFVSVLIQAQMDKQLTLLDQCKIPYLWYDLQVEALEDFHAGPLMKVVNLRYKEISSNNAGKLFQANCNP